MKNFYIICLCFFIASTYGQASKTYTHYVEMSNNSNVPVFKKINNKLTYQGDDLKQKQVFAKYNVLSYEQAFPDAIDKNLQKVYVLKTTDEGMVRDLLKNCKENYKSSEDITDSKVDFLYQPNDYGSTSTLPNLGANISRKDLDYLHAPDAWEIMQNRPIKNIKIGISDTQMRYDFPDLQGKVTITSQTPPYLSTNVIGYTNNESVPPYINFSHGTMVAALAAAKGNNSHGTVGVCMDCSIVEGSGYIGSGSIVNGERVALYSNLYKMAKEGAKVINMSWCSPCYLNDLTDGSSIEQAVINDLVNNYRVTLVAAAGNESSFSTAGIYHVFPASYENVISVSSINHQFPIVLPLTNTAASYCCTSPWFPIHGDIEDSVSPNISAINPMNPIGVTSNGYWQSNYDPNGLVWMHTLNDKVDVLAAGYNIFDYDSFVTNNTIVYRKGTSYAAPLVTGTIGLMLSLDECLIPKEIESILKLTAKDIEPMPINIAFKGLVGSGKLEIGNAVKFVDEMIKPIGNAVIENHIFNRFNFSLARINNKLTIKNAVFKENCSASFTARNVIEIASNSDFVPNSLGAIDLKLDGTMNLSCSPVVFQKLAQTTKTTNSENNVSSVVLYPNPNKGVFTINLGFDNKSEITVDIHDTLGKTVYKSSTKEAKFETNLTNLPSGLYFIKLHGENYEETLKFIKE